ncbi:MAG: SLC13 family permease [Desulfotalea sp.]
MENLVFTQEMGIVLAIVGITVILFLTELLRVDVVAILVMVSLPLLGIISGKEAFAGLSSNAVVSIIAVIIIGRGLDHTGVVNQLSKPLIRLAGNSENKIMILVATTVAIISSFMQNVGAAALFLPVVRRMSKSAGVNISKLLMPIGFSAILGGTITLVGSSPLIMLNDLISPYNMESFGLFSVAPIGIALLASGILYFLLIGKFFLPNGETLPEAEEINVLADYPNVGELWEITVPDRPDYGCTVFDLEDIDDLCEGYELQSVAMSFSNKKDILTPPDRLMSLSPGAKIAVYGHHDSVHRLAKEHGFSVSKELTTFGDYLSEDNSGVVEALVAPHSEFIGKAMIENRFRHNYLLAPLALTHNNEVRFSNFQDIELQAGDSILMHGSWKQFQAKKAKNNLLFAKAINHEILRPDLALRALASFGIAMLLVFFTNLALSVSLMAGALGMILTKVITIDEAYQGVDWRTVFLLAGLIPLGGAMQSTGAATWIASGLMTLLGTPTPLVFTLFVAVISTTFTLVVSNVGAVVLLIPLAIDMANQLGADPRLAALVVALAASNSFLLPTHQVNALYMGPGKYKSIDYLKAGLPLTIIFILVLTAMITLFY